MQSVSARRPMTNTEANTGANTEAKAGAIAKAMAQTRALAAHASRGRCCWLLRRLGRLLGAMLLATSVVQATTIDLEASLRGMGPAVGARAAEVDAITQAFRVGDFPRAQQLARELRNATPGVADHELLLALSFIGGEQLAALAEQISTLDASSVNTADRIRIVAARHFRSQGRNFLAQYFLRTPRTPEGERERLQMDAQVFTAAQRITAAQAAQLAILKRDRDNADALLNMARLHLLEHKPSRALAYAKRIAVLNAAAGKVSVEQQLVAANAYMLVGDLAQAERAFADLSNGPFAPMATFNLALISSLRGDYAKSLRAFRSLSKSKPMLSDPLPGVVLALLGAGDANAAHALLSGAQREPGDPLDALLAAAVASAQGDWPGAGEKFHTAGRLFIDMALPDFESRRALGTEPVAAALDLARRNYLYRLGYFRLAASGEVPGGGRSPAPVFSLLTKARSAFKAGRSAEALELYSAVIRASPQLITPLVESADIHFFEGKTERAIRLYQQAVKAQPQLSVLRLQLGDLLSASGRAQDALQAYAAITLREPDNAHAASRIASVLFEAEGDARAALPHAQRAHRAATGNAQITALLGRIQQALGDSDSALTLLRQALNESRGNDPQILAWLGDLLLVRNESEKARRAYERALNFAIEFAHRPAVEKAYLQLAGLDART